MDSIIESITNTFVSDCVEHVECAAHADHAECIEGIEEKGSKASIRTPAEKIGVIIELLEAKKYVLAINKLQKLQDSLRDAKIKLSKRPRELTVFNSFVKENMPILKANNIPGTSATELMRMCAKLWQDQKNVIKPV